MLPLNHPANADAISVTVGTTYSKADVLVIDRTWFPSISPAAAGDLIKQARADGTRVLYSIDDNLLDLKAEGFNRYPFTTEQLMAIRYFAREADGIIVATNLLKERLSLLNDNIFVIPNSLDERLWSRKPLEGQVSRRHKRKVIGYMGTHTHDADLMMILQAMRKILRKNSGLVELQLLGCVADRAVIEAFEDLPVRTLDVEEDNVEYPAFVRWMVKNVSWDLAVAPLEDNAFTHCKSDIKFLDYSILGIPGIYSQGPVYGKTVRHLETGYLAENDTQSWLEALELMLTDDALRQRIAKQAKEYTDSTRTLQHCATNWREVLVSIFERGGLVLDKNLGQDTTTDCQTSYL
jgi:glycosyltransferase involved in cell wall biosynthesis